MNIHRMLVELQTGLKGYARALEAMIVGLKKQSERNDFVIDMGTFGFADANGLCFGCAATCAIQELSGVTLTAQSIGSVNAHALAIYVAEHSDDAYLSSKRKYFYDYSRQLSFFEYAIDAYRLGTHHDLLNYCKVPLEVQEQLEDDLNNLPPLTTDTWERMLPSYERHLEKVKMLLEQSCG